MKRMTVVGMMVASCFMHAMEDIKKKTVSCVVARAGAKELQKKRKKRKKPAVSLSASDLVAPTIEPSPTMQDYFGSLDGLVDAVQDPAFYYVANPEPLKIGRQENKDSAQEDKRFIFQPKAGVKWTLSRTPQGLLVINELRSGKKKVVFGSKTTLGTLRKYGQIEYPSIVPQLSITIPVDPEVHNPFSPSARENDLFEFATTDIKHMAQVTFNAPHNNSAGEVPKSPSHAVLPSQSSLVDVVEHRGQLLTPQEAKLPEVVQAALSLHESRSSLVLSQPSSPNAVESDGVMVVQSESIGTGQSELTHNPQEIQVVTPSQSQPSKFWSLLGYRS